MQAQNIATVDKKTSATTRQKKAFDITGFHDSVKNEFEAGKITLEEAAREFYEANWTPFIDMEYTKKNLGI
ncbi:hypothetical protein ACFH4J_003404 [Escherichia coli]